MEDFTGKQSGGIRVALADLMVLGCCAAIERPSADAGVGVTVQYTLGRRDPTQELADIEMVTWLKAAVDGFRNYVDDRNSQIAQGVSPEQSFLDEAELLAPTAPEWVVLVGGLRVMGANYNGSSNGVFTDRVGVLSNDFFTVLTSMSMNGSRTYRR